MVSSKFTVGPRRYNATSMSPQAGKGSVNPNGYRERDMRAKVKQKMLKDQLMKRKGK